MGKKETAALERRRRDARRQARMLASSLRVALDDADGNVLDVRFHLSELEMALDELRAVQRDYSMTLDDVDYEGDADEAYEFLKELSLFFVFILCNVTLVDVMRIYGGWVVYYPTGGCMLWNVQRSSRQHLDTDPVVGVMGLDFSMNVFYYYLTDTFTECEDRSYNGCFIIDDGGFVVMHRDWLNLQRPQDAYNIHISKKEPGVAKTLIENNIMQRRGCINHEQLLKQYTWLVSMQSDSLDYNNFVIYNIRETNLFVVLLKNRVDDIISACLQISASLPICVSYTEVECPCADKLEFSYCDNELEIDTDTDPPCAPFVDAAPMVGSFSSRSNLEPCHDYQCEGRPERECIVTTTCTWNGKSCSVHSPKEKGSSKTTVIAVVVVLLVVVAIAAVVGGIFYWKRKGSPATTSNSAGRSASYVNDSFDMGRHEPPPSYGDVCESNN
ncbi:hypothetical protein CAPTEDRAFT_222420 [Capitella teleta]|uniref:Uncharacterized protein n=1 Tax=Capitella teleta TaxID=283909 RepID=R7T9Q0_CAPTE|nr:hypothetical protein CAPTEDRAFT_222420 [Capitella teleta]|eukprot:ELT90478.1 hypothetical protein CAPTEDRAFT_222420 [Capitella teleta]